MTTTRSIARSMLVPSLALALAGCETEPKGPLGPGDAPVHSSAAAASETVVVSPGNMHGWLFYQDSDDSVDPALGTFVPGPGSPAHGVGSVQIATSGESRPNLATYQFGGTPLAEITALGFSTWNGSAGNGGSATRSGYLQFNVDFNVTDAWQRRMVFLPGDNGAVVQDAWQEWDAVAAGTARWRYSGATWPGSEVAGSTPRLWSEILAAYPGVRIRVTDAFLGIRVGEPYRNGYTENIDALTFGTTGATTRFDFEPYEVAANADQCRGDGWRSVTRSGGSGFRNQGDCVQYVNTGR